MSVLEAIRDANALLPGEPVPEGLDPRWQAIIEVGEYIESEPAAVWSFIRRWGSHPQEDLRSAIARCLLEHLLEYHFGAYFRPVEQAALADPLFADTFLQCSQFGQSEAPANAVQWQSLRDRLVKT
jgi:hypothetical protein